MKMATTIPSVCGVPGTDFETSHRFIPNLHHKVGDVVLILLINKTKQNKGLASLQNLPKVTQDSK